MAAVQPFQEALPLVVDGGDLPQDLMLSAEEAQLWRSWAGRDQEDLMRIALLATRETAEAMRTLANARRGGKAPKPTLDSVCATVRLNPNTLVDGAPVVELFDKENPQHCGDVDAGRAYVVICLAKTGHITKFGHKLAPYSVFVHDSSRCGGCAASSEANLALLVAAQALKFFFNGAPQSWEPWGTAADGGAFCGAFCGRCCKKQVLRLEEEEEEEEEQEGEEEGEE